MPRILTLLPRLLPGKIGREQIDILYSRVRPPEAFSKRPVIDLFVLLVGGVVTMLLAECVIHVEAVNKCYYISHTKKITHSQLRSHQALPGEYMCSAYSKIESVLILGDRSQACHIWLCHHDDLGMSERTRDCRRLNFLRGWSHGKDQAGTPFYERKLGDDSCAADLPETVAI